MSGESRLRVLPVAIAALAALGVLKITGLAFNGFYALSPVGVAVAQDAAEPAPAAPDPAAMPAGDTAEPAPVAPAPAAMPAGDTAETAPAAPAPAAMPAGETTQPAAMTAAAQAEAPSPSERAVLESLRQRREQLDQQESALLMRENLLRAAEQRVDAKVAELKAIEKRIQGSIRQKEEADDEQFADLVSMYESMKPKAAAQIFDRMDITVVVGVARRMQPESLAQILARMDPAMAERVTVELAQISQQGTGLMNELDAVAPQ